MAGAIAELAKRALAEDFHAIDPRAARIILVEAASRVLTPFDEKLSEAARRALGQLGVEVRLGAAVTDCSADGVQLGETFIPARTIIWAAGVMASPAGRWLGAETDRAGRPLDGRCTYDIDGQTPAARLWTLTAYDAGGHVMANAAGRSGFLSREILRRPDGSFLITASSAVMPGNWLPVLPVRFKLVLRLYDTPLTTGSQLAGVAMPAIIARRCP